MVMDAIKEYLDAFRKIFCHQRKACTVDFLCAMLEMKRSEEGSDHFVSENKVITYWRDSLQDIEENEFESTFKELLAFCTGFEKVPPLGFLPKPIHNSKFSTANTCSNVLRLPTSYSDYPSFKQGMEFAIRICKGYDVSITSFFNFSCTLLLLLLESCQQKTIKLNNICMQTWYYLKIQHLFCCCYSLLRFTIRMFYTKIVCFAFSTAQC